MRTPHRIARDACCTAIVVGPQLLGGATPFSASLIAVIAAVAMGCAVRALKDEERRPVLLPAAGGLLSLHIYTAVQALPLPCGLVRYLAPGSAALTQKAFHITGQAARVCSISYDPVGTQQALSWTGTVLCMALSTSVLIQLGERKTIIKACAASCGSMALVALLHRLAGATSVYGLYQPVYTRVRNLAPILNENHLGAFVAFGMPLMCALGLRAREKNDRALWFLGAVLSGATAILTSSRGAATMLALETVMFVGFLAWRVRRRAVRLSSLLSVSSACAAALAMGTYAGGAELRHEFAIGGAEKIDLIEAAWRFTAKAPLLGLGRGAFGAAFTETFGTLGRAEFAESLPVQWAADWGYPLAAVVLGWATWWVTKAAFVARTPLQGACVTSLLAFGIQNLMDFGVDMTGVVMVVVPLFVATVLPERGRRVAPTWGQRRLASPLSYRTLSAYAVVACCGVAVSAVASVRYPSFEDLHREWQSRPPTEAVLADLQVAVRQRPSDARLVLLAAATQASLGGSNSESWNAYAAELAPGWAGPRVLEASRLLHAHEVSSAARLFRLAAERDPASVGNLACPMSTALLARQGDVTTLIPVGRGAGMVASFLNGCTNVPLAVREECDELAVARDQDSWKSRERLAFAAVWNSHRVLELLEPALIQDRASAAMYCMLADAYDSLQRPNDAEKCLRVGAERSDERNVIYEHMAARYGVLKRLPEMHQTLAAMRADANGQNDLLADAYSRQGRIEEAYGSSSEATAAFEKSYRLLQRSETLVALARLAETTKDRVRLARVRSMLCQQGDANYCPPVTNLIGK